MKEKKNDNEIVLRNRLEIDKLASDFPDCCAPIFEHLAERRNDMLRQLSAKMPDVVHVVQTANSADTYRVVKNVVLTPGEDGLYTAVLRDDRGRIIEHVKLEKAASDFSRAAAFSFSVLNAAVGQANMMAIAERLAEIESQLDEAKERDYCREMNEVKSAYTGMKEALCLKDDDHFRQTIIAQRDKLRTGLENLRDYILIEIKGMKPYHKRTRIERLISNWGTEESTLTANAQKHFKYIRAALPVWFFGMSQLVLTEPYIRDSGFESGDMLARDLRHLVIDSNLYQRVQYVPKIGDFDPIDAVKDIEKRLPEMEKCFERMKNSSASGDMILTFNAD